MAESILDKTIDWNFITAENFLEEESKIIEGIYSQQLKNREKSEKQGIKDWGDKKYIDQGIESWQFKSIIRDQKSLELLIEKI
ncbi:MAG: hypothetical protein A2639_02960 [Candidatus Staskawiczbacteria bacterium RIFCSPHIGHO2_01_FULL_34_27]|uniref:Uncharacterized protein n=1 Tax=Candidatus Staskawiczbacteria bacterium RIFCSPHIGHO2_01_FULL_34_27 TaxID=1802199 RepID=A0A1G2HJU2_9BACT|nr:MAG: hypothetical protein A2639_02960 [Candidatus Staskawiczbacteria bacterium RIFCSPHIGHO2_01_FULL_34_27]